MTLLRGAVRWWAPLLFGVGAVVGTWRDPAPERPVLERAGQRVLQADFHAHTRFSDGVLSPFELVVHARRSSLDVLGVTEHNLLFPARMAGAFSSVLPNAPLVVEGEEITARGHHVIALGLSERIDASLPLERVLDEVHDQGGVVVAAHPVRRFWPGLEAVREGLDGAEVMHPLAYRSGRAGWSWEDMPAFYARGDGRGGSLTAVGSSDYHFFSPLGVVRTYVFVPEATPEAVVDALADGRTVVVDLQGRAYGPPELVRAVEREPLPAARTDYGYRGEGALDRVARTLGWLGLLGVVLGGRGAWPAGRPSSARRSVLEPEGERRRRGTPG